MPLHGKVMMRGITDYANDVLLLWSVWPTECNLHAAYNYIMINVVRG